MTPCEPTSSPGAKQSNFPPQTTNDNPLESLTFLHISFASTMFRCSFAEPFRTRAVAAHCGIMPYLGTRFINLTFHYSLVISHIYYYIVTLATEA
ncbi:uncharacterized protein BDW70DRAFT_132373 [Aspergillus foveolatus]|uniref:uncharacterized protein n=1 Tax=Aspergillus foveolatus TaxID=210207 RepID=UPI003CCE10B4